MAVRNVPVRANLIDATPVVAYICPVNVSALIISATATNTDATNVRLLSGNIVYEPVVAEEEEVVVNAVADASNRIIESFPVGRLTDTVIDNLHGQALLETEFLSLHLDDVGTVNITLTIQETF